jgi:hypothetical protein
LRLAEIKNGFFGFLAQVFDSWAEFLRLRIEARNKKGPARKDPFVSSPPEHWLELAAGLSFMEGGLSEIDETEPQAFPQTLENDDMIPDRLTGEYEEYEGDATARLSSENEEMNSLSSYLASKPGAGEGFIRGEGNRRRAAQYGVPQAKKPASPEDAAFIGKRLATPAEADLVAREHRSAPTPAKFLTFSDEKKMAARPGKFVPVRHSKPTPARFFSTGTSSRQDEETFVPTGGEVNSVERSFIDTGAEKNTSTGSAGNLSSQAHDPKMNASFVSTSPVHSRSADFPGRKTATGVGGPAFSETAVSAGEAAAAFAKGGDPRPAVSPGGKFVDTPAHSFPQGPAEFPRQVVFAQPEPAGVKAPTGSGLKENAFFPIPARKASAEVFPPGQNIRSINDLPETGFAGQSKWAELPAQDLSGGAETPEAEHLRLRHMALLEREQKGERWSV